FEFGFSNFDFQIGSVAHSKIDIRNSKIEDLSRSPGSNIEIPKSKMSASKSKIEIRKSKIRTASWRRVRLFAMDVDGILTNGSVQISSDGSESKGFSVLDGMGLKRLEKAGVITAWISGR